MARREICQKCEAAQARATEALGLLTHWQGRASDLETALVCLMAAEGGEPNKSDQPSVEAWAKARALLEAPC